MKGEQEEDENEENGELSNRSGDVSHNYVIENNVMLFSIITFCNVYLEYDTVIK